MSEGREEEPVTVTDKRRIDPQTGEVREASGPAPSGPAPGDFAGETPEESDKAAELLGDLQRVQADFANYRKRALRDQQVAGERAKAAVVSQLLPILDDLDRARSHGDLETSPLKSVADKLTSALAGLGLTAFGAEGDEFDPSLHEAVQHEGEGSKPVLGNVMRQGYRLGDQVLRHALVGVVDTVDDGSAAPQKADTPVNGDQSGAQNAESN
ncbi:nucleotide exchange factor GrpE [Mycolicibacterium aichiense]|uniref:Protein GrpE n=1 Tax=Mycolicibacterium aromaticivorans JS19b1 = JCM 16368 TaxID=1440774 RepID=A0A064CIE6_9MYCO|nr:nucleotide exchange factor GrpE [Mycolicibacterium aromaticivorans]KDF00325.1 heat shock protein GrpE [Mycolicibacterium aromaticivorans JS19b1 = JCM 16368]